PAQVGFLHDVFGFGARSEHAVGNAEHARAVSLKHSSTGGRGEAFGGGGGGNLDRVRGHAAAAHLKSASRSSVVVIPATLHSEPCCRVRTMHAAARADQIAGVTF